MKLEYLLSLAAAVTPVLSQEAKQVFAHFMVGNAASMTPEDWKTDIELAKKAHIDGFAMNVGHQDSYTDKVLRTAYDAAEGAGDFTLFLSFDYATGGPWTADEVIKTINAYKDSSAQTKYKGKPLVSTFAGTENTNDWPSIKEATGCFSVPSWTGMGPNKFKEVVDLVDGFFSWDAWPVGAQSKSVDSDHAWMDAVGDKVYMMPVSPWFYTNLPQWNKNWLWRGDDLWHERWEQVIELQPELVEIITWNDYGESHYIGPIYENGIPEGAGEYVIGYPHEGWLALLPEYIDAYKSGNSTKRSTVDAAEKDTISYWYRRNPSDSGDHDGTTGNNPDHGQEPLNPGLVSEDKVFLTVLVKAPSEVSVQIGSSSATKLNAKTAGINHLNVPFGDKLGPVTIKVSRDGKEVVKTTGPEITDECKNGKVNWNAYVGSSLENAA